MHKSERQRGDRQQCPNAERYLRDDRRRDKTCTCEDGIRLDQFRDIEQLKKRQQNDHIAEHAMIELDRERIFKKIPPQWHLEEQTRGLWNKAAID